MRLGVKQGVHATLELWVGASGSAAMTAGPSMHAWQHKHHAIHLEVQARHSRQRVVAAIHLPQLLLLHWRGASLPLSRLLPAAAVAVAAGMLRCWRCHLPIS